MAWSVLDIVPDAFETDKSGMSLPDGTLTNVNNIDFYAGCARSLPDLVNIHAMPAGFTPYAIQYYSDSINQYLAFFGTGSTAALGAYALADDDVMYDIMPATGLTGAAYWDTTAFGKWLVVTNDTTGQLPHAISASTPVSTTNLAPLPNFPANWESTLIRTHRNVLWIGNTVEAGIAYPNRVRWSTSAPTDGLPAAWVPTSSNDAGQNDLEFIGGTVTDFAACGDVMFISGAGGLYAARWIGGQYVYRFSKVIDQGARGLRCMEAISGNTVAVLTNTDLILATESETKSIAIGRVRDIIAQMVFAEVVWVNALRQLYITYKLQNDTGYAQILIWDMDTNTFGFRYIPNTPLTALGWGINPVQLPNTTWEDWIGAWDETTLTWSPPQPNSIRIFGANSNGLYIGGNAGSTWSLSRTFIPIPEGETARIDAVEIEVDGVIGSGISLRCGVADYPSGETRWNQLKSFSLGNENLRNDIGFTGKYISYEASGNKQCRITRIRFYYNARAIKP